MAVRRGVQFLATDIWDTPDDGKRYEVIDGELYVAPPPVWKHQNGLANLLFILTAFIRAHDLGKIVPAPVGVVLDEHNGIQPDIIYIRRERLSIISERGVEGAPDLVVEVLSPSTRSRDKGVKMRRYAAAGIPHYWQLDPRTDSLEAYRLGEQGYQLVGRFGPGSLFRPELFPGLEIPIDDLWR
jgi:Uma2 family endonuclease